MCVCVCVCARVRVRVRLCGDENKDREVEEGEKEVSTELGGFLSTSPRTPPGVSKGWA